MESDAPTRHRPTLANVQALRALASLMVIFVHLARVFAPMGAVGADTGMFSAGVDLFFVISGFIMVYTTAAKPPSPRAFLLNRIARLVPIYWLVTLLLFAMATIAPRLFSGTVASPIDLIRSLLFIPYVRADGLMRPILFVGWSLNLEMMFYVLFAVALTVNGFIRREFILAAVLLALVVWHISTLDRMGPVTSFLTQPLILEFALGMLVGVAFPHLPCSRTAGVSASILAPFAFALLLWTSRFPFASLVPAAALPATALLLAALIAECGGVRLHYRWILSLGDASYTLYLTHPFVTQAITIGAVTLNLITGRTAVFLVVVTLAASVTVATIVHRLVERPLSRATHQFLQQHWGEPA